MMDRSENQEGAILDRVVFPVFKERTTSQERRIMDLFKQPIRPSFENKRISERRSSETHTTTVTPFPKIFSAETHPAFFTDAVEMNKINTLTEISLTTEKNKDLDLYLQKDQFGALRIFCKKGKIKDTVVDKDLLVSLTTSPLRFPRIWIGEQRVLFCSKQIKELKEQGILTLA